MLGFGNPVANTIKQIEMLIAKLDSGLGTLFAGISAKSTKVFKLETKITTDRVLYAKGAALRRKLNELLED